MSAGPSHDHAAAVAARAALNAGATRLGIAILTHIAGRGTNFQTDEQLRQEITKPNGLRYHRESIGRKRREHTRWGHISAKRYGPGQRPPGAKWATSHGVVVTRVVWPALRVSTPTLRGARTAARVEARRARAAEPPEPPMSAAEVASGARAVLDMLDGIGGPPRRPPPGS